MNETRKSETIWLRQWSPIFNNTITNISTCSHNICKTLVAHTHNSRNMACVCTTRVIHMFTQADLLIVIMATVTLIMFAPCASGSTWNVCYRVRCCHLGVCDKLPNWAGVGRMKQVASEKWFLKDGHVIMLSLIGYTLNQTNKPKTSLAHW